MPIHRLPIYHTQTATPTQMIQRAVLIFIYQHSQKFLVRSWNGNGKSIINVPWIIQAKVLILLVEPMDTAVVSQKIFVQLELSNQSVILIAVAR